MNKNIGKVLGVFSLLVFVSIGYAIYVGASQSSRIDQRTEAALEKLNDFQNSSEDGSAPNILAKKDEIKIEDGQVLFINRVPGSRYGRLAIKESDNSRTVTSKRCQRVHVQSGVGLCLKSDLLITHGAETFNLDDPELGATSNWQTSLPSRARVSPNAKWLSGTYFINGRSYEDTGSFSSVVEITNADNPDETQSLNEYKVNSDDSKYTDLASSYWGLTFENDNDFYVTFGVDNEIEILKGDIENKTLEVTGILGSCPSVSPNGKNMVFKKMNPDDTFQLAIVNLETGEEILLNETRSVDDQITWLNDENILYAVHSQEEPSSVQPEFDIWQLNIADGTEPVLFMPNADSPTVVR